MKSASVDHQRDAFASQAILDVIDRDAITQIVLEWGFCRDSRQWERPRSLYTPGAIMWTTWFAGSAEEFVRRSAEAKGSLVNHVIGPPVVAICGDRAVAISRAIILVRTALDGIEVDITCHGRFHDWFVRLERGWRILRRTPVYEKDRIDPVDPSAAIAMDPDRLSQFPTAFRHLAYAQALAGQTLNAKIPTSNSEEERAFVLESERWLSGQ